MKESILRIPTLPSELITEILARLPVKSLLKFKSISKSWLDLISSPEFIKSHLDLSANNKDNTHHRLMWCYYESKCNFKDCSLRSLLYESDGPEASESNFNYPMKNQQPPIRSMNHVNGLICFADWSNELFLWNPSIRKYKKLPHSKTNSRNFTHAIYGFGYDKFHDDYKVVACTYYYEHPCDIEVLQIYSLKSDSWRNINSLDQKVVITDHSGKFVNGKLYWINYDPSDPYIFYFDLVDEKWEKIEQPPHGQGDYDLKLGLYGSDLSIYTNNWGRCVTLWVMKKSWMKIFTIKCDASPISYVFPYFISNKGEIVVGFASTNMIMYNPKDDSLRLAVIDFNNSESHCWYAEIYVESLVSPFST